METFRPQLLDRELVAHAHRVELRGSPRQLAWPPLCPACGAAAAEPLEVAKVFIRRNRWRHTARRYSIARARIPFCASCAARHRTLSPPMSPVARTLSYLRSPGIVTVVFAAGFAAVIAPRIYGATLPAATTPDEVQILRFARQLPLFLVVLAVGSLLAMFYHTRRYRVAAQTDVTSACDFSDDLSQFWEREFRVWTVRDPAFFTAFADANRHRVVTGDERAARNVVRSVVFVLLILVVFGSLLARHLGAL